MKTRKYVYRSGAGDDGGKGSRRMLTDDDEKEEEDCSADEIVDRKGS